MDPVDPDPYSDPHLYPDPLVRGMDPHQNVMVPQDCL